jgi:predicted ATP-binding protein involved in virulence
VLIDEIELHLHPTLQQEILQRLQKTFPKIQFIATTHSPLVISNFKADANNKIIKLEHDGNSYSNEDVENVFGLDYSTNLSEIMEVAPRSSTIDKYINAYLILLGKKKETEADLMLQKLKDYLGGEIPTLLQKEIDNQKKAYL